MSSNNDDKTTLLSDQKTLAKELEEAKKADACLIVIRGNPQGHKFPLDGSQMILGREADTEISISDPSISRKHLRVDRKGSDTYITDLGSSNGTYVNNVKLDAGKTVKLEKEDMVKVGSFILKYLPSGALETLFFGNLNDAANADPLTGVANRRYFNEVIDVEMKRAKALSTPLSLLFFDIDFFKKINDTYGHDAGDEVLKEFSGLIKNHFTGPKDTLARLGGEEFVLLCGMDGEKAKAHAEKIRSAIEGHEFNVQNKKIPVTCSIGVSQMVAETNSPQDLVKAADEALYQAKDTGRNKVVFNEG